MYIYIISHLIRILFVYYTFHFVPTNDNLCAVHCVCFARSTIHQFACVWFHEKKSAKLGRDSFLMMILHTFNNKTKKDLANDTYTHVEWVWKWALLKNTFFFSLSLRRMANNNRCCHHATKITKPMLHVDNDVPPKKKEKKNRARVSVRGGRATILLTICGNTINVTVTVTDAPDNVMRM